MRNEFNNLRETLSNVVLFDDKVGIALNELEQKIIEVEKRIECAIRSNQEVKKVTDEIIDIFHNKGEMKFVLHYGNFEIIERGINDVDIALNLNDIEPIENNWYGLFGEPKREIPFEEPKVLIPKGSIVKWDYSRKYYSVIGGAEAIVSKDYLEDDDFILVEWIDNERRNNQENGGYDRDMFKEEFELPKVDNVTKEEVELSNGGIPYRVCYHCAIKEEQNVMTKVNGNWLCYDCYDEIEDDKEKKLIVTNVINMLKDIDVDGETMQYIIEQVGMSEQMLRQLIMNNPETDTKDLLEEKIELSNNR